MFNEDAPNALNSLDKISIVDDIADFFYKNKDKIDEIFYNNAYFRNFTNIRNSSSYIILEFQDCGIIVQKSCVLALVKTTENYKLYYCFNNEDIMFEMYVSK